MRYPGGMDRDLTAGKMAKSRSGWNLMKLQIGAKIAEKRLLKGPGWKGWDIRK